VTAPDERLSWRRIGLAIFAPAFLFSIGRGAILASLAPAASEVGAGVALAGLVVAVNLLGELAGSLPSGWLVNRVGEWRSLAIAAAISAVGALICLLAPSPWLLALGSLVSGLAAATFAVARTTFMTVVVSLRARGRAMSALAGANRVGLLVGPFGSAALIGLAGASRAAFVVPLVTAVVVLLMTAVCPDPVASVPTRVTTTSESGSGSVLATLWRRREVLVKVGLGVSILTAIRASRTTIVPLWAVAVGLDGASTALLVGVAAAVDAALFYPGGALMDRFGRLAVVVPALVAFATAHLMLAVSALIDGAPLAWLIVAAMLMAAANGLTSGVVATIGADLSDPAEPAVFLGPWKVTTDLGTAGAPLLISALTAVASLAAAAGVMGGLGVLGAVLLFVQLPRYLHPTRGRESLAAIAGTEAMQGDPE
jgi:MFS family permease